MSNLNLLYIALMAAVVVAPPIPRRIIKARSSQAPAIRIMQTEPDFAGGGPDDAENLCVMFKTTFATQTNWIYYLEWSPDLTHWIPCEPEIDGTGQEDYFFDVNQGCRSYRIVARPGQLP